MEETRSVLELRDTETELTRLVLVLRSHVVFDPGLVPVTVMSSGSRLRPSLRLLSAVSPTVQIQAISKSLSSAAGLQPARTVLDDHVTQTGTKTINDGAEVQRQKHLPTVTHPQDSCAAENSPQQVHHFLLFDRSCLRK